MLPFSFPLHILAQSSSCTLPDVAIPRKIRGREQQGWEPESPCGEASWVDTPAPAPPICCSRKEMPAGSRRRGWGSGRLSLSSRNIRDAKTPREVLVAGVSEGHQLVSLWPKQPRQGSGRVRSVDSRASLPRAKLQCCHLPFKATGPGRVI